MALKTHPALIDDATETVAPPPALPPARSRGDVTEDVLQAIERLIQCEEREAAEEARRLALCGPAPIMLGRDRNGVQVALLGDDGPTPERMQHASGIEYGVLIGKEKVPAARIEGSTPLRKYLRDRAIDDTQFKAGLTLHADFIMAGIEPRVISAYREPVGAKGSWDDLSASQADARRRYVQAMTFVHHRFRPVLVHVVCLGFGATDWALSTGRRGRAAIMFGAETLRYGLDDLHAWYELAKRS